MSKFVKVLSVIFGIFMIVGGLICMFTPGITYLMIGYVVGLSMIFDSIGRFINWGNAKKEGLADGWMLTGAILSAVFGFFILNSYILQLGIDAFIIYYIAIWLICDGIIDIIRGWKIRRLHKIYDTKVLGTSWYLPFCVGILMVIFGIFCCIYPIIMAATIGVIIGISIVIAGASIITFVTTPDNVPNK